jgi:hypothetical protein
MKPAGFVFRSQAIIFYSSLRDELAAANCRSTRRTWMRRGVEGAWRADNKVNPWTSVAHSRLALLNDNR